MYPRQGSDILAEKEHLLADTVTLSCAECYKDEM